MGVRHGNGELIAIYDEFLAVEKEIKINRLK